jgi:phenylacetic acid degradation operon negative regulatory protein
LSMPQPLARIVEQLKREPSRTGSIVITVFGDAIVPRGGSVWLGTLLEFFKALDIDSGVVRTAMSRLTADGWLERNKVGRNSFYRLVQQGAADLRYRHQAHLRSAAVRLDRAVRTAADRQWRDRDASREALKNAGFGSPLPGVWVAPSGVPVPEEAAGAIRLEVSAEDDSGRRLLSESWPLDRTADAYLKFMKTFEPLRAGSAAANGCPMPTPSPRDPADPPLPPRGAARPAAADALLPRDWPGRAARSSAARSIAGCFPRPNNGLTAMDQRKRAVAEAGGALARRFGDDKYVTK